MTTEPLTSIAPRRPTRRARVDRSSVILTSLSVVFALLVLLQMLPGTGRVDAAASGDHTALTLPIFVAGAVVSVLVIAAVLVSATRRLQD